VHNAVFGRELQPADYGGPVLTTDPESHKWWEQCARIAALGQWIVMDPVETWEFAQKIAERMLKRSGFPLQEYFVREAEIAVLRRLCRVSHKDMMEHWIKEPMTEPHIVEVTLPDDEIIQAEVVPIRELQEGSKVVSPGFNWASDAPLNVLTLDRDPKWTGNGWWFSATYTADEGEEKEVVHTLGEMQVKHLEELRQYAERLNNKTS